MSIADEASGSPGQLQTALDAGIDSIDRWQTIVFSQYTLHRFSEDGYVFWVKNGTTLEVSGSLHYATDRSQAEDETIGVNSVIFTALEEVTEFNTINPSTLWIADFTPPSGATIKVAFSKRTAFYSQAKVWHYTGFAVYPALQAQLVTSTADLPAGPIVSNSLPIWLTQNQLAPVYASFLVPENIVPPYITAHIEPDTTEALQPFPIYRWTTSPPSGTALAEMTSSQLMRDQVRLTFYGFNAQQIEQFKAQLIDYSLNTDAFGFCSDMVVQDAKRNQAEISALAQKKTIDLMASYYMGAADAIARRLILSASVSITT